MRASEANRDKSADSDRGKTCSVSERNSVRTSGTLVRSTSNPPVKGSHFGRSTLTKQKENITTTVGNQLYVKFLYSQFLQNIKYEQRNALKVSKVEQITKEIRK